MKMAKRTKAEIAHVVVNVVCFVIVVALAGLIEAIHIEPFKRGFFCNDETIRYPYFDDTVSVAVALVVGLFIPLVSILVCEWIQFGRQRDDEKKINYYGRFLWIFCIEMGIFMFGGALCQLGVSIVKLTAGRLRPHFIDVCDPDFSLINCSDGYITNYVCRGTDGPRLRDGRMSFPSGHSSFIGYAMVFAVLYLHVRAARHHCGLVKHVLQFGAAMTAAYVCVSRVCDYKHHYTDVICGLLIGAFFAILTKVMLATHWTSTTKGQHTSPEVLPLRYKSSETVHSVNM